MLSQSEPIKSNDISDDDTLFMTNESVIFKDGQGRSEDALYIGPIVQDDTVQHKIKRADGKEYLVDSVHLSPIDEPDISNVPITTEEFALELPNLTREQLDQIAHPEILDDDQRELMALHCKLNHIPLPALITMAESGKIKKRLAKLKERLPVCIS